MPDNQLDILIKLIADASGAKLTADEIAKVKDGYTKLQDGGEQTHEKIGAAAERMSFRTQRAMTNVALSMSGISGPAAMVLQRLEYIQFMAERSGMSIMEMMSQAGAGIAGVAGAALVVNQAVKIAEDADKAWIATGLTAQGFFGNLAIGYGVKEVPKISATLDFHELGLKEIEAHLKSIQDRANALTHQATAIEQVQAEYAGQEQALGAREAEFGPLVRKRAAASARARELDDLQQPRPGENSYAGIRRAYDRLYGSAATEKALEGTELMTAGQKRDVYDKLQAAVQKVIDEARLRVEEVGAQMREKRAGIKADRKKLDEAEASAIREALYKGEEAAARRMELAGDKEGAAKKRATIRAARDEGVYPGLDRYKDIEAAQEGVAKATREREKQYEEYKKKFVGVPPEVIDAERARRHDRADRATSSTNRVLSREDPSIRLGSPEGSGFATEAEKASEAARAVERDSADFKRSMARLIDILGENGRNSTILIESILATQIKQASDLVNLASRVSNNRR